MATTTDIRLTDIENVQIKQRAAVRLAAGATLVKGAHITVKSDGFAIGTGTIDVTGGSCGGIAFETISNTGSNGDVLSFGEYGHTVRRKLHANITAADVNHTVYVYDNDTVARAGDTTGKIVAGVLRSFDGATGKVQVAPLAQGGVGPTGPTGPTGP